MKRLSQTDQGSNKIVSVTDPTSAQDAATKNYVDSGTATLTNKTLTAPVINQSFNAQTGTTYTLVIGDAGQIVTLSNASAITMTVPTNASVAFAIGTRIDLIQIGAGQVTTAAAGGVTINSTPGLKLSAQYSGATLLKTATDTWILAGDLSA